jgi:hypothetical protein
MQVPPTNGSDITLLLKVLGISPMEWLTLRPMAMKQPARVLHEILERRGHGDAVRFAHDLTREFDTGRRQ